MRGRQHSGAGVPRKAEHRSARTWLRLLTGGLALTAAALQSGCQTTAGQVVGCKSDDQCGMGQMCDLTGQCVPKPKFVDVTIVKSGDGDGVITSSPTGLNCGDVCTGQFEVGKPLTLTATPAAGSTFSNFSIGCNSATPTCQVTPTTPGEAVMVLVNFGLATQPVTPPLCNSYGFCWENARPQGNRLNRAFVLTPGEVWAVGEGGTIVRRSGTVTTLPTSGTARNLYSIWGTSGDLYAVGAAGTILRNNTGSWVAEVSPVATDLYDVWGSGGTVYAVGAGGTILKRSGGLWSKETSPTANSLRAIVGLPSGDLFAVGDKATLVRGSGGTWTASTDAMLNMHDLRSMSLASSGVVYLAAQSGELYSYTSGVFKLVYTSASDFSGIAATPTGIVAVGRDQGGLILRSVDGMSNWLRDLSTGPAEFSAVTSNQGETWAVGEGGSMYRYDGTSWLPQTQGRVKGLRALSVVDAQNAFAVGAFGTVHRWNGKQWSLVALPFSAPSFSGVQALTANDVWAVGETGAIWHWNGTSWGSVTSPTIKNLRAVWGTAANKLWAVGDAGTVLAYNGTDWSTVFSSSTFDLYSVFGTSATDLWAAGQGGAVLRSTGGAFTLVATGPATTATIGGIWGTGPSSLWFAADTDMFRWDGSSFTKYTTAVTGLRSVWGSGPTEALAVGNQGALLSWNPASSSFTRTETGFGGGLYGVAASSSTLWLVGDGGAILSRAR